MSDPSSRLPLEDLAAAAERRAGEVDAALLGPRLAEALAHDMAGKVAYTLDFAFAPVGGIAISGTIHAELEALCQRCLEPFRLQLTVPVRLIVPPDEIDAEAPAGWEFSAPDMRPSLIELIEEELLLALPLVPRHPPGVCHPPGDAP